MIQVFGGQGGAEIKHTLHIVSSININFHASTMIKGGVCTCACMCACMCVLLFHDVTLPAGAVIMVGWGDLQSWQTLSYSSHISMVSNLLVLVKAQAEASQFSFKGQSRFMFVVGKVGQN